MSSNQPVEKSKGSTGKTIGVVIGSVVGVFILCVLVAVCTIAILTLLGPQVANVFSKITNGLSTGP